MLRPPIAVLLACVALATSTSLHFTTNQPVLSLEFESLDATTNPATTPNSGTNTGKVSVLGTANLDSTPQVDGSSLVFNGSSTHIRVPDSPDWDVVGSATDNWTVDFWVKHSVHPLSSGHELYVCHYQDSSRYWCLVNQGMIRFVELDGSSVVLDTGYTRGVNDIPDTKWHHVALVKVQSNYGIYLDGKLLRSVQDNSTFTYNGDLVIGYQPANGGQDYLEGRLDSFRISKENIFGADPTEPGDRFAVTRDPFLLLEFESLDGSTSPATTPNSGTNTGVVRVHGTASLDTKPRVDGSSMVFDGSSSHIRIQDSSDWDVVGSTDDDWTIDFWIKHAEHPLSNNHELYVCHYQDSSRYWCLVNQGMIRFVELDGTSVVLDTGYTAGVNDIPGTKWHHVALVKVRSHYGIYVDGKRLRSVQDTSTQTYNGDLVIGYQPANGGQDYLEGRLDSFRITKGNIFGAEPDSVGDEFPLPVADSDGDGIANHLDACVDSDVRATIYIESEDTGVNNDLLPDGCTLADLITETLSASSGTSRKDAVGLLVQMKRDGLITGAEMGAILKTMR